MNAFLKRSLATVAALAVALSLSIPVGPFVRTADAAATTQTTHAFLCRPKPSNGTAGPARVVNLSSTASTQPSYSLNNDGCAVIAGADIGYFLSQGYFYGPNQFTLQQTAITANQTSTTSTIVLPAYAVIQNVILCETAGNAVTGGVNIGDSGSATRFASAVTLSANACVAVADSALTRIYVPSGVPTADQILIAAQSAFNSASVNITIIYSYF